MQISGHRRHDGDVAERGAEIVQLVLAFPVVIIFVFAVISLALAGYSASVINSQVNTTAWAVDVRQMLAADTQEQRDQIVRDAFASASTAADMSRLTISDARYAVDYTQDSFASMTYSYDRVTQFPGGTAFYYPADDTPAFEVDRMVRDSNGGYLTFKVHYDLPMLVSFAFLDGLDYDRTITVGRVLNTRTDMA